jgi:GH24 family phage-related lysozyme (muramidase)
MVDYNPYTVGSYQQMAATMAQSGGGRNMSGLGARPSNQTNTPTGTVDFTTIDPTTGTQTDVATIDFGDGGDSTPNVIYAAAANAATQAGSVFTPQGPMTNAINLYSMPNMVEQASDFVYRADRDDAITSAISDVQAEEQEQINAAISSVNSAITMGKTDAEIAEAFLNDMGGFGNDKPDETGGFGVQGTTLEDVTDTQQGLMTNPQPLYDFAEEMRNPSITETELPPMSAEDQASLGAAIRKAAEEGTLSSKLTNIQFVRSDGGDRTDPSWWDNLLFGEPDGITDVSPAAEAPDQLTANQPGERETVEEFNARRRRERGLMAPTAPEAETPAVTEELTNNAFQTAITRMEGDHGDTPVPTNDASEAHLPPAQRSKDVGYGHKVKTHEDTSGMIHGVRFKDEQGNYIALTEAQKRTILQGDIDENVALARRDTENGIGWDTKLANIDSSWDELDDDYKDVLGSLAFNVGGGTAGREWTAVLTAAKNENLTEFARHIRRQDNNRYTRGMDNRAMKELYAAGLITRRRDVQAQLPLADGRSGVPR